MAKRIRVTEDERQRIIAAFETGKSCNQIAREFERAPNTISRIAREVGHKFAQANAVHARELKAAYDDERRAKLRLLHADAVEQFFQRMFGPAVMRKIGGKDNVYTEQKIPEPSFQDMRDLSYAVRNMMHTINQMDQMETGRGDLGILDLLFQRIENEADEYRTGDSNDADQH